MRQTARTRPLTFLFGLACALASTSAVAQEPQHGGVFASPGGDRSGYNCWTEWRTSAPVDAHAEPDEASEIVRTVDADRRIEWNDRSESLTVVVAPGAAVTKRAVRVVGGAVGSGDAHVSLPAGTEIEMLSYGGDAYSYFRVGGVLHQGIIPSAPWLLDGDPDLQRDFRVAGFPETQVWLRLVPRPGKPAAWLNVDQLGVERSGSHCEGDL